MPSTTQNPDLPPADAVLESVPDNARCAWRGGGFRVMEYTTESGQRWTIEQGNASGGFVRVGEPYTDRELAIAAACGPV